MVVTFRVLSGAEVRRAGGGGASDWSVVRIYPRFRRLIGPSVLVRRAGGGGASDWSVVRIYPRFQRLIGPS
eukprot:7383645-Pyramimonas_sp.AAC.1